MNWTANPEGPRTCYVDNADGTRAWYAETLDGTPMRFEVDDDGSRVYQIDPDAVEAAAMLEAYVPTRPALTAEEFRELTEAVKSAGDDEPLRRTRWVAPNDGGGNSWRQKRTAKALTTLTVLPIWYLEESS